MKAVVRIRLRPEVLDAPGRAVSEALQADGFTLVRGVRIGKLVEVDLATEDADEARTQLTRMGERLLAHPVVETFDVELLVHDAR
jgi:phosphoribosylformylglycinamidine synthase PurS subunit